MSTTEARNSVVPEDRAAIAGIVRTFFAAFTSGPDCAARLDALRAVFLPEAVIIRTCGAAPAVYGVDTFIAPRQALLSGGTLVAARSGSRGCPRERDLSRLLKSAAARGRAGHRATRTSWAASNSTTSPRGCMPRL